MNKNNELNYGRRDFLRRLGFGAGTAVAMTIMDPLQVFAQEQHSSSDTPNRMTYRVQHGSGEQIS